MKKVIVIGAGAAGLAEATYLSRCGFEVTVIEKNSRCGGLCTTWERSGYSFESCLYWVFGTDSLCSLNKIWRELCVDGKQKFIHFENFMQLEDENSRICFPLWSDLSKLTDEMKKYGAGRDGRHIDRLLKDARRVQNFNLYIDKPSEMYTVKDYAKLICSYLPYLDIFIKYGRISLEQYVKRLESPVLRGILLDFMQHIENYPMILNLLIFSYMDSNNADYPEGGSYEFIRTIETTAKKCGAQFLYNTEAEKIVVKNDKAAGVILKDGRILESDYVVSCCDGYNTLFNMLGGKYIGRKQRRQYEKLPVFLGYMQISFGIEKDLSDTMQFILYKPEKELLIGGRSVGQLRIRHYSFNAGFAPDGCTSLVVTFKSDYDYWNGLYEKSREEYAAEKRSAAEAVLDILDKKYGRIRDYVRVTDVATPKTFQRITYNRSGSAEGWYTNCSTFGETFECRLKGLKHFYMAGHWTNINGGVTFAALTARNAAQLICRDEKVDFVSEG